MLVGHFSEGGLVPLNLVGVEVYQILFACQFIHFMLRIFSAILWHVSIEMLSRMLQMRRTCQSGKNDPFNWLKETVHEAQ